MVKISKTYVPKLTEKYMCEKHKAYFKKKLTEWKSEIIKANNEALYNGSIDDNSVSADIVDQASSYTDKNVEMKAINRQIKLISKIDSALKKIQDGTICSNLSKIFILNFCKSSKLLLFIKSPSIETILDNRSSLSIILS